jgi:hypothetical protein
MSELTDDTITRARMDIVMRRKRTMMRAIPLSDS